MAQGPYDFQIKNIDNLQRAIKQSPEIAYSEMVRALENSAHFVRQRARQEAPKQTGNLRRSIQVTGTGLERTVGPDIQQTPYAIFVHRGTGPYTIRPKTKKALYWKGAKHPVKVVHHPGIKANPFMERARDKMENEVSRLFNDALKRIIKKIQRA